MILATHAVIGASTALIFRQNPIIGLTLAFVGHFIFDIIPHWHYPLKSLENNSDSPLNYRMVFDRRFLKDLRIIGIDFALGILLSLFFAQAIFNQYLWLAFFGAVAGVLPDFLQLVYYLFPRWLPIRYLQIFHEWIHAKKNLDKQHFVGINSQVVISALFILLAATIF